MVVWGSREALGSRLQKASLMGLPNHLRGASWYQLLPPPYLAVNMLRAWELDCQNLQGACACNFHRHASFFALLASCHWARADSHSYIRTALISGTGYEASCLHTRTPMLVCQLFFRPKVAYQDGLVGPTSPSWYATSNSSWSFWAQGRLATRWQIL